MLLIVQVIYILYYINLNGTNDYKFKFTSTQKNKMFYKYPINVNFIQKTTVLQTKH